MKNLLTRALTGAAFLIVMVGAIRFGSFPLLGLFMFIVFLAVYEFFSLTGLKQARLPVGAIAAVLLACSPWVAWVDISLMFLLAFVLICLMAFFIKPNAAIEVSMQSVFALIWIAVPFVLLLHIGFEATYHDRPSYQWLLAYFVLLWVNDTFAYLIGKAIGRHPLAPKVSAGKTIEGTLGGIIFTIGAAIMMARVFHLFPLYKALLLALVLSPIAVASDLFESLWKRKAGVKDSGNILPGHGGMLDRFDSVFFTAPCFYAIMQL